jgi:hypothetical protein
VKKTTLSLLMLTGIMTIINFAQGDYIPDADTLHLYNFNDGTGTDSAGTFDLAAYQGATIANGALSTFDGGISTISPLAASVWSMYMESTLSNFIGADGSFTFEAMVRPDMPPGYGGYMQIISCDSDGVSTDRGFHFRIDADGTTLRFQTLSGVSAIYTATIAYTAGEWYHAAVSYDAASGNLELYWTPVGDPTVYEVGAWSGVAPMLGSTWTAFCVGNELRDASGYGNENFEGLIDEVRISRIGRAPEDMSTGALISGPVIVSDPTDATVREEEAAAFTTLFTSPSVPSSILWYKTASPADLLMEPNQPNIDVHLTYNAQSGEYTSTLTMTLVTFSDIGQYYCRVVNDSGFPQYSNVADLTVQGCVAHWTLDQDTYANNHYQEEIGGYDAAAAGTPTFVPGADGFADRAVQITAGNGWALCPVLDPVKQSGQMTVSFWAKWAETPETRQDLLAESSRGESIVALNGLQAENQWQHVCTVYDGSTGKLYIDGVLAAQGPWQLPGSTEAAFTIGIGSDLQNPFNGAMDDLRIYNYALNKYEVADIRYALSGDYSCILEFDAAYDLSGPEAQPDCTIDLHDLAAFANAWMTSYGLTEFADLASTWLSNGLYPADVTP